MYLYTAQGQYVEYFASNKRCEDATGRQDCSKLDDCKWENEECGPKCDTFNDKFRCGIYPTCKWNNQKNACDYNQRRCSGLSKTECNDEYDCKWMHDECVPNCNTFERSRCETTPACEWDNKNDCFFKNKRCTQTTMQECNKHNECSWKNETCVPRCDMFDKGLCESYKQCAWDPQNNSCNMPKTSCGKIDTEQECRKYNECSWKNECLPRCDMFDKARCDSYKDCIWNQNRNVCGFKDT